MSNGATNLAYASIFVAYLLFVYRMYAVIDGGNGMRIGSVIPGMLETFGKGEKWVTFDNIEGIDGDKFVVVELVNMLRNPKKYDSW